MTAEQNTARTATGRVVSNKMDKTVTVLIERRVKHPAVTRIIEHAKTQLFGSAS